MNNRKNTPLVSVITLMYNSGVYVVEALDSLLEQTVYNQTESIIIDDGSKDNSVELIKNWIKKNDFPCTLIINEKNLGIPKTVNKALGQAVGKYYTFLSDDLWLPDYLETQLLIIEAADESTALVYSDVQEIDSEGKLIRESFLSNNGWNINEMPEGYVFEKNLNRNFIPAIGVVVKKEIAEKLGMYDERLRTEDVDMWLRMTKLYKIVFNPENLVKYRRHDTSFTVSKQYAISETKLLIYDKHWGFSDITDNVILKKVKKFLYGCYFEENKELSLKWLSRINRKTPQARHIIMEKLFKLGLNDKIAFQILRILKKVN